MLRNLLLVLVLVSCTSTMSIKPIDAGYHTLFFEYLASGEYRAAKGVASAVVDGGEERKIRVLVPKGANGNLMVTDNGDDYFNVGLKGKSWVDLDLAAMPHSSKSYEVGLAMVTKNYGIMTGRLRLIGNLEVTAAADVDYRCPYKHDYGPTGACLRPAGYSFTITININEDLPGKMRVEAEGVCDGNQGYYDIGGAGSLDMTFTNDGTVGYCIIRVDTRQDKVGDVWRVSKFKEINVNYYDPDYVPLAEPDVERTTEGYTLTPADEYKAYYLNGKHKKTMGIRTKIKVEGDDLDLVIWDKYGRTSHVRR